MKEPVPWSLDDLRRLTPARVALGRAGPSLPTTALLDFTLAHARARDAVHAPFRASALLAALDALGCRAVAVASRAGGSRQDYLKHPDLGRSLDQASIDLLQMSTRKGAELTVLIGDGLSPTAVHAHAIALMRCLLPYLATDGIKLGEVVVASGARVALGDEIGALLGARMVVVLIGERPGLSAPDSLGAYLTYAPRIGRTDAERNCVSNIHRKGLSYEDAALKIAWLIREGLTRNLTGVALKDESGQGTRGRIAPPGEPA
jgi:ethanolamine ammonia-lyase small subunit